MVFLQVIKTQIAHIKWSSWFDQEVIQEAGPPQAVQRGHQRDDILTETTDQDTDTQNQDPDHLTVDEQNIHGQDHTNVKELTIQGRDHVTMSDLNIVQDPGHVTGNDQNVRQGQGPAPHLFKKSTGMKRIPHNSTIMSGVTKMTNFLTPTHLEESHKIGESLYDVYFVKTIGPVMSLNFTYYRELTYILKTP